MKLSDLSNKALDSTGRNSSHSKYIPPMPVFEYPWRFVRGGWTPEMLDSKGFGDGIAGLTEWANFPQIPATTVVQAMIDAFDDEGDVPLYAWDAGTSIDVNTTPVYTREGVPVQNSKQQYAKIGTEKNPGGKLSDELIRYSRITGFIFEPQSFLSFSNIKYNLNFSLTLLNYLTVLNFQKQNFWDLHIFQVFYIHC